MVRAQPNHYTQLPVQDIVEEPFGGRPRCYGALVVSGVLGSSRLDSPKEASRMAVRAWPALCFVSTPTRATLLTAQMSDPKRRRGLEKYHILWSCAESLQLKTNHEATGLIKKLFQSEPSDSRLN